MTAGFPWIRRVPYNTLLQFPTPKPIKRGGLIRLEEIGWGGEEGGAAKLPLKQSFKAGPCKTLDKDSHQDVSTSLHILASTKNNADKSIDFCWAICQDFIKRLSGVDCKRAASQMSLLLRIWTNAWEHIIQFFLHLNQPDNPGAIKSSLNFDIKKFNSNATNTNNKVYSACIRDPDVLRFSIILPDLLPAG